MAKKDRITEYKVVITMVEWVHSSVADLPFRPAAVNELISIGWVPLGGPATTLYAAREVTQTGIVEKTYLLITQALTKTE